jgi:hypothetical protein
MVPLIHSRCKLATGDYLFTGKQISRQMNKIWDTNKRKIGNSVEVKFVGQNIKKIDK